MSSDYSNPLEVSSDFIDDNKKLGQTMPKKGGRYTKQEIEKRRSEVYRLHFDHGFSARKIADFLKINRNTINEDIRYWYSKAIDKWNVLSPEDQIVKGLLRLEIQRNRLRAELDKTDNLGERLTIEKLLSDIESKMIGINTKLCDSELRIYDLGIERLNKWMEKNGRQERYMTAFDMLRVSEQAGKRIKKILEDDKINPKTQLV